MGGSRLEALEHSSAEDRSQEWGLRHRWDREMRKGFIETEINLVPPLANLQLCTMLRSTGMEGAWPPPYAPSPAPLVLCQELRHGLFFFYSNQGHLG